MEHKRISSAQSADFAGKQKEPKTRRQTSRKKDQLAAARAKRHNKENIPPPPSPCPMVDKSKYDATVAQSEYYKKGFNNAKKRERRLRESNSKLQVENKKLKGEVRSLQKAATKSLREYQRKLAQAETQINWADERLERANARLHDSQKALKSIDGLAKRQKAKLLATSRQLEASRSRGPTFRLRNKGTYSWESRKLARLMVQAGCSQSQVGGLLQSIGKSLGIKVERRMSRRTVRRAIVEGGIAAEIQLASEVVNAKNITISQDSTSNRKINYEAKHINVRVPDYQAGETTPTATSTPKSRCVGVASTVDHSSAGSVESWKQQVNDHADLLKRSPLGQRTGEYSVRLFLCWLNGIHGDHANNEKCVGDTLKNDKRDAVIEDLGEKAAKAAIENNAEEMIAMAEEWRKKKIDDVGGLDAWNALSPEEQNIRDLATLKAMYTAIGLEKFEKLTDAERKALTLFFWVGCCMHKDMNAFKGGNAALMAAHALLNLPPPITLANKANAALLQRILDPAKPQPADGTLTETEMTALEASTRGAVKLLALAGAIFNHKDDKKGQQDAHLAYFGSIYGDAYHRFPDTSNERFGTYGEAATEIISDLQNYRNFVKHIHDSKVRPGWTNIELNVWNALHDIPTLTELVILSLYSQTVCRPYLAFVRGDEDLNALDLGPFHKEVQDHVAKLIDNPDILLGKNPSPRNAVLKSVEWDPVAMSAIDELKAELPNLRVLFVKFLEGALVTWVRFSSEYAPGGLIEQSSVDERSRAWMPPTNDVNEGLLGSYRVFMRKYPRASLFVFNAMVMYKHNNTQEYMDNTFGDPEHRFTMAETRQREASGCEQKRRDAHAAHDKQRAAENVEKGKEKQRKLDERTSRENDAIRSTPMLKDPAHFTEAMSCAALDVQILHYIRWDASSMPRFKKDYKLKSQKIQVLQEASKLYQARGGVSEASKGVSDNIDVVMEGPEEEEDETDESVP